jgi:hypothetical protein
MDGGKGGWMSEGWGRGDGGRGMVEREDGGGGKDKIIHLLPQVLEKGVQLPRSLSDGYVA